MVCCASLVSTDENNHITPGILLQYPAIYSLQTPYLGEITVTSAKLVGVL